MNLRIGRKETSVLKKVRDLLPSNDVAAYLVGGWVRDTFLGRETRDIDIALGTDALGFAQRVSAAIGGRYVLLDKAQGVARVVLLEDADEAPRWHLDFSTIHGTIEEDLSRRDFTINAMAMRLSDIGRRSPSLLVDPYGGKKDLEAGVIRAVSASAFRDDPARLIRGIRLAAEYGFTIDPGTEALISAESHLIGQVAGERVREEFCRILSINNAAHFISYLDHLGLLTAIIPELTLTKGVDQPKEHYWDVFDHSVQTVAMLERLLDRRERDLLAQVPRLIAHIEDLHEEISPGLTGGALVKLAALLHDIAKPQTKMLDHNGRIRFFGHPTEGAQLAGAILQRLRFSSREIRMVQKMIESHLRLGQMSGAQELPTRRAIYRYFRDTAEASIGIMFLTLADFLATHGPNLDAAEWRRYCHLVEYVLEQREEDETLVAPPKLISGHDIMREFGLKPGPGIGELLEAVREAQGSGEISTPEEALALVRKQLGKRHSRSKVIS